MPNFSDLTQEIINQLVNIQIVSGSSTSVWQKFDQVTYMAAIQSLTIGRLFMPRSQIYIRRCLRWNWLFLPSTQGV